MVPALTPSSTHALTGVSCQVTEGEGPQRLLLTPENVSALGAHLPVAAEQEPNCPAGPKKRRKGRKGKHKPRRVRKASERSNRAVWSVVPAGYKPARHIIRWLRSFQDIPEYQLARKDLKANIWRFANALAQCPGFDPASMTMMPLWQRLHERFGFPLKSISNYFRRLRDWRALAVVATGRTAEFTPQSSGKTDNEAAIYVLLEPLEISESGDVEKSSVPVPTRAVNNPPHARAGEDSKPQMEAAPPLSSPKRAAQRREVNHQLLNRKEPFWDPNAATNAEDKRARREAERLASLELQFRSFPLQRISTAHVAAVCRPFLRAGWTVKDVLHAIDWRPNTDARYHHDGANGVENVGAWLRYRLGKWVRPDGGFYRSPSQKLAAEHAQRLAERQAAAARRDRERDERAQYTPPSMGWRERVLLAQTANGA
ncbi:hypothetical protein AHiyo1_50960 [Arthrobacter sp. Hiyo1]|uniref:hypothetical protein n=1 Tax=Arthrobacter sp. Hiyo1 TaxID=1588020 RepID=UPI0006A3CB04|nr:hypothetical protein [Arthrobacter sp. Hiyo1]GAP61396.1 hypothetical protein AHiyo1_50960 [Arthrobacter sp. Hiyo1]